MEDTPYSTPAGRDGHQPMQSNHMNQNTKPVTVEGNAPRKHYYDSEISQWAPELNAQLDAETAQQQTGEGNAPRKFKDLAIGERFNFVSTFVVPTDYETATWEKTGNRTYRRADGSDETRGREMARIYNYKYVRRDHRVGTINVEIA